MLGAEWDDDVGDVVGARPRGRRHRGDARGARGDLRGRPAQPAAHPRHPRPGRLRGAVVPLRPLGPRRRPHRQARRDDRRRRERLPDRADDRRARSSTSPCSSAPRSGCSRTRTTTRTVGPGVRWALRAPAVLRALVPLPDLLARLRQGARGGARRPGLPRPAARGQRDQRPHPPDVHRLDHQPGRRRPRAARQGRARLPGHRQAHAAGQRQLAAARSPATTSSSSATGIDHIEPDAIVTADGERHEVRRDRLRHRLPRQPRAVADGRSPAATAWTCRTLWGERPAAYLGITVPGFPNLFCMYGPGTNLAHGGSLIFHSECQMRYISQCLDAADRRRPPHDGAAPGRVHDEWLRAVPGARSRRWCGRSRRSSTRSSRTPTARSTCLSPWRLVDYWAWTKAPDPTTSSSADGEAEVPQVLAQLHCGREHEAVEAAGGRRLRVAGDVVDEGGPSRGETEALRGQLGRSRGRAWPGARCPTRAPRTGWSAPATRPGSGARPRGACWSARTAARRGRAGLRRSRPSPAPARDHLEVAVEVDVDERRRGPGTRSGAPEGCRRRGPRRRAARATST